MSNRMGLFGTLFALGLWGLYALVSLGVTVGIIYAIFHFVSKFW